MKKIVAVIASRCLFLTGCSGSFNWDKSVSKLQDTGYSITRNYTAQEDLDKITHELNSELKMHDKDCTVEVIRYMSLGKEEQVCIFLQFKEEDQAKSYYDLRLEIRYEDSDLKLAIYDDVVLIANSSEVVELLKLNFN